MGPIERARKYRDRAEEMRITAIEVSDPDVRDALLQAAETYDLLAAEYGTKTQRDK